MQYIGLRQGGSFPFSVYIVRDAEKLGKIKMTANLSLVWCGPKIDETVKSRESTLTVMPAKAGIQEYQVVTKTLDPGFRRGDDFLRERQRLSKSIKIT